VRHGNNALRSAAKARRASFTTTATIHRADPVKNSCRCVDCSGRFCSLCALRGIIFIGKNSQNRNDQTSEAKPETVEATPNTTLSQFLQNQKNKQSAVKKVAFPRPPTTGIELSAKLLENFPERVLYKQGWLDGQFYSLGGDDGFLSKESVGFWIWDKDGDLFMYCFANKAKFGDLLLNLRRGDGIRIIGEAGMLSYEGNGDITKLYFRADSIQVIK
jgi:hypothetical protein